MAFDQHIEADRIGDFNLFSAFVRVPLLILEGVLGQQSCESPKDRLDTNEHGEQSSQSECPDTDSGGPSRRALSHDNISSPHTRHDHVLQNRTNNELSRSSSSLPSCTDMMKSHGLKRSRKMSWSDESGLSLVEYSDEVSDIFAFLPFSFQLIVCYGNIFPSRLFFVYGAMSRLPLPPSHLHPFVFGPSVLIQAIVEVAGGRNLQIRRSTTADLQIYNSCAQMVLAFCEIFSLLWWTMS